MENTPKRYWFVAKCYGWGWRPKTWEGWLIMLVWIALNVVYFLKVDGHSHSNSDTLINFSPVFIVSTLIFLGFCYAKGEKPYWRWGDK